MFRYRVFFVFVCLCFLCFGESGCVVVVGVIVKIVLR